MSDTDKTHFLSSEDSGAGLVLEDRESYPAEQPEMSQSDPAHDQRGGGGEDARQSVHGAVQGARDRQPTDHLARVRRDFPSDDENVGLVSRRRMSHVRYPLADVSNDYDEGGNGGYYSRQYEQIRGSSPLNHLGRDTGVRGGYSWTNPQLVAYGRGQMVALGREQVGGRVQELVQELLGPRYGIVRCFGFHSEYRFNILHRLVLCIDILVKNCPDPAGEVREGRQVWHGGRGAHSAEEVCEYGEGRTVENLYQNDEV